MTRPGPYGREACQILGIGCYDDNRFVVCAIDWLGGRFGTFLLERIREEEEPEDSWRIQFTGNWHICSYADHNLIECLIVAILDADNLAIDLKKEPPMTPNEFYQRMQGILVCLPADRPIPKEAVAEIRKWAASVPQPVTSTGDGTVATP